MGQTDAGVSERAPGPLERVYDEHFAPLVKRLVALSNEHQIPLIFVCELDVRDGGIVTPVTINADDAFPLQSARACNAFDAIEDGFDGGAHVQRLTEFYEAQTAVDALTDKGIGVPGSQWTYTTENLAVFERLKAAKTALASKDGG